MLTTLKSGIVIILLCMLSFISTQEEVKHLPDYPYKGQMYSGYLTLDNPKKKLHYLFIESQRNPSTDPLVLWLNGGPGCSSLLGWAQEHGPAMMEEDSVFTLNPYSWNKVANMIYLESPANVGFSYNESDREQDLYVNDEISGLENLQAMIDFFRKFPNFKNNDFYISGESYAGIYVPTLASNILDYNSRTVSTQRIKLKGMLIGNGVTDWKVDTEPALIDFAYSHALYSPEVRKKYIDNCVNQGDEQECRQASFRIQASLSSVNIYDIYRDCYIPPSNRHLSKKNNFNYTPWLFSGMLGRSENNGFLSFLGQRFSTTPPCVDSLGPDQYFNRQDVKAALNVRTDLEWGMCSDDVGQHYDVDQEKGSYYLYPKLLGKIRILIYSGDTDAAVPVNGTQKWISNLKLNVKKPWRSWRIDNPNAVAGYITEYEGLTFVTVKGTGHMVPQWKPKEAYHMFTKFLEGQDL